jgi:uncharacterized protein YecT (DUF1311 family)
MKIIWLFSITVVLLIPTIASAEQTCQLGSQAFCDQENQYKKADAALNRTYQKIIRNIQNDFYKEGLVDKVLLRETLIQAQMHWLTYRDSHCKAYYTFYSGGTSRSLDRMKCLTEETEKRTQYLVKFYNIRN